MPRVVVVPPRPKRSPQAGTEAASPVLSPPSFTGSVASVRACPYCDAPIVDGRRFGHPIHYPEPRKLTNVLSPTQWRTKLLSTPAELLRMLGTGDHTASAGRGSMVERMLKHIQPPAPAQVSEVSPPSLPPTTAPTGTAHPPPREGTD